MVPDKGVAYVIDGVDDGEIRWDCKMSDDDEQTLRNHGAKVVDFTVHCDDVKDNCKVVYELARMDEETWKAIYYTDLTGTV